MKFKKIRECLNKIRPQLYEGLNKNEYTKIIKDVLIGVELEVVTDEEYSNSRDSDYYRDIELTYSFDYNREFYNTLVEANHIKDTLLEIIEDSVFQTEVSKYTNDIYDLETDPDLQLENTANDYIRHVDGIVEGTIESARDNLTYMEYIKDSLNDVISNHGIEYFRDDLNNVSDEELKDYVENIKQGIQDVYFKYDDICDRLRRESYILDTELKRHVENTLQDMADSDVGSGTTFEDMKDSVEDGVGSLLEDMDLSPRSIGEYSIVEDGSLGNRGVEVVTSAVTYDTFLDLVPKIVSGLSDLGFYGDEACGYHIGLSSDSFDIKELIKENYKYYQSLGFNKLTSLMVATQQGYKSVYRHNSKDRQESEHYAQSFAHQMDMLGDLKDPNMLKDVLYSPKYNERVDGFFRGIKYSNTNLSKSDYVELRTLGGSEGFDIMGDPEQLKLFLYDAISQVFGGVKKLDKKEVIKLMQLNMRKLAKEMPLDTKEVRIMRSRATAIGRKVLEHLGDKILDKYSLENRTGMIGNDYKLIYTKTKSDEFSIIVYELDDNGLNKNQLCHKLFGVKDKLDEVVSEVINRVDSTLHENSKVFSERSLQDLLAITGGYELDGSFRLDDSTKIASISGQRGEKVKVEELPNKGTFRVTLSIPKKPPYDPYEVVREYPDTATRQDIVDDLRKDYKEKSWRGNNP